MPSSSPILNYTTTVPPERTVGEIVSLLARKQARSITQDFYEDGRCKAVSFILIVGNMPTRFQLPVNIDGVAGVLLKNKPYQSTRMRLTRDQYSRKLRDQAEWISWRILKDWIEAQLALVEAGMADAAQVFLPYVVEQSGKTIYQLFVESNQAKALGDGNED